MNENEELMEFPVALIANMYSKIQTKKQRRNEFLLQLVRIFDNAHVYLYLNKFILF